MSRVRRHHSSVALLRVLSVACVLWLAADALVQAQQPSLSDQVAESAGQRGRDDLATALGQAKSVAIRLPVAAALGAALAFRPKRRGTPPRSAPVVQTQIILGIIGALVMLVVGASLARAFGVVGVAGLIRYRAKIDDPKDASVMLGTLALGLAAGVGLYVIAVFGSLFILAVLWLVESIEPHPEKLFLLKVSSKSLESLQPRVERLLRRQQATFELRGASPDEVSYEVHLPVETRTDVLSNAILAMDDAGAVEWEQIKKKG